LTDHIKQDGNVVRNTAGQDKQMPGGMEVADSIQRKEDDSQRVRAQPYQTVGARVDDDGSSIARR
jgi:hypothetical protein